MDLWASHTLEGCTPRSTTSTIRKYNGSYIHHQKLHRFIWKEKNIWESENKTKNIRCSYWKNGGRDLLCRWLWKGPVQEVLTGPPLWGWLFVFGSKKSRENAKEQVGVHRLIKRYNINGLHTRTSDLHWLSVLSGSWHPEDSSLCPSLSHLRRVCCLGWLIKRYIIKGLHTHGRLTCIGCQ